MTITKNSVCTFAYFAYTYFAFIYMFIYIFHKMNLITIHVIYKNYILMLEWQSIPFLFLIFLIYIFFFSSLAHQLFISIPYSICNAYPNFNLNLKISSIKKYIYMTITKNSVCIMHIRYMYHYLYLSMYLWNESMKMIYEMNSSITHDI